MTWSHNRFKWMARAEPARGALTGYGSATQQYVFRNFLVRSKKRDNGKVRHTRSVETIVWILDGTTGSVVHPCSWRIQCGLPEDLFCGGRRDEILSRWMVVRSPSAVSQTNKLEACPLTKKTHTTSITLQGKELNKHLNLFLEASAKL